VLTGTLAPEGFHATNMTAKCPSKYEPQAVGTAGPTGTTTN
jgi:cytochrome c-type biogenesis protein CcmE